MCGWRAGSSDFLRLFNVFHLCVTGDDDDLAGATQGLLSGRWVQTASVDDDARAADEAKLAMGLYVVLCCFDLCGCFHAGNDLPSTCTSGTIGW
eukprot:COSAG01_NODE_14425_length_1455_cov_1.275811_3_plen_93_part_01